MLSGAPSAQEHHQFCWRLKEGELTFQFFLAWKRPLEKGTLLSPQQLVFTANPRWQAGEPPERPWGELGRGFQIHPLSASAL